jgi:hypothetical protein
MHSTHPAAARSSDFVDEEQLIAASALGTAIAADLSAAGFVAFDDDYSGFHRVYRLRPGAVPARVLRADLDALVRKAVLEHARISLDDVDAATRRRSASTLRAVEASAFGVKAYLRRVRTRTVELIDEIGEEQHDEIRAQLAAARAASALAPTETDVARRARQRAEHAEHAERDRAALEDILRRWLPLLGAGRHDLAAVWGAWQVAVARSERIRTAHPGVAQMGRNRFYAALAGATAIHTGRSRSRWIVVQPAAAQAA